MLYNLEPPSTHPRYGDLAILNKFDVIIDYRRASDVPITYLMDPNFYQSFSSENAPKNLWNLSSDANSPLASAFISNCHHTDSPRAQWVSVCSKEKAISPFFRKMPEYKK